ncbi:MAG: NYN domain-containing protein [Fibromonadaceae bacterium]|jgi:hypothetical protein|nr:NYN domain-containing protein [Fibromonadaceae bacterium]
MKKAYFCIDGFSFKRINDYYRYEHKRRSRLNLAVFESYLRYEIARKLDFPSDCENLIFEKHFYHPSRSPRKRLYQNDTKESILKFEENLARANYSVHYSQKAPIFGAMPNEKLLADTMLAVQLRKIDIFILLSTQGQHANALRQMKNCQIPTILLGWNASCKNSSGEDRLWKTDRILYESASAYCPLEKMLDLPKGKDPFTDIMFEKFFNFCCQPEFSPKYPLNLRCG